MSPGIDQVPPPGGEAGAAALLEVRNLEVTYNRIARAVQGISLTVGDNAIVGIVGINGAGKTTTLSAIAGFPASSNAQIAAGEIIFLGADCAGVASDAISRKGLALVPEREKIFVRMSVRENLIASTVRGSPAVTMDTIFDLFPRLAERRNVVSGYLSGGERQMLAIAMAMLSGPRLLLIDEFSLGLSPAMVETLMESVRELRRRLEIAVLFVEQSAANATELADAIYVMENGRIVLEGPTDEVERDPRFRDFYLGMAEDAKQRSYRDVRQYSKRTRWFG